MRQVPTNGDPGTGFEFSPRIFIPSHSRSRSSYHDLSRLSRRLSHYYSFYSFPLLSELVLLVLFHRGKRREFAELLHSLMPIKLARKRHKSFKHSRRFLESPLRDVPDGKIREVVSDSMSSKEKRERWKIKFSSLVVH